MHSTFIATVLALGTSVAASAVPRNVTAETKITRCGVSDVSLDALLQSIQLAEWMQNRQGEDPLAFEKPIEVDTYVHVVSSSEDKFITVEQIQAQMDYLNSAFKKYWISFKHQDTSFTASSEWAVTSADGTIGSEMDMKRALRRGSYKDLNLYYVDEIRGGDWSAKLGTCTFPFSEDVGEGSERFNRDGCMIAAQTVPGGSQTNYNLGGTTVHQVGHWFHLWHSFSGGCGGVADSGFWDIAYQAYPTEGCPKTDVYSCQDAERPDPIHNFMDFSYDECYEEFSWPQVMRMRGAYQKYRQI